MLGQRLRRWLNIETALGDASCSLGTFTYPHRAGLSDRLSRHPDPPGSLISRNRMCVNPEDDPRRLGGDVEPLKTDRMPPPPPPPPTTCGAVNTLSARYDSNRLYSILLAC